MALVNPHGSAKVLTPTLLSLADQQEESKRAQGMPKIQIGSRESGDILMIAMGAFSPLVGFMGRADFEGVVGEMRLKKADPGVLWPLPVTLAVSEITFQEGDEIALYFGDQLMASMLVEEIFEPDKRWEAEHCFMGQGSLDSEDFWRLAEDEHPGVQSVMRSGRYYVGGPLKVISEMNFRTLYGDYFLHPTEARAFFAERGWSTVAAFQARNPIHRSQEFMCKVAQEMVDGLFIHALVGNLQPDEIPAEVRMQCYKGLVDNYFNPEHTILAVYPMDMRYGGPREALLHAIFRQNFGCSHLIVGRDHAGVGDFYGFFEAQTIFDTLWEGALEISPLKMDWMFWSHRNNGMVSLKTCPIDDPVDRVILSGTKFKRLISEGKISEIPPEFSRPEVLAILAKYYLGHPRNS